MPSRIHHITFDCRDPFRLGRFWAEVLGFGDDPDDPNLPDDPEVLVVDPTGRQPGLLFIPVPEGKTVKNRVHLDLRPEQSRDAEVQRLLAIGATLIADHRNADGTGWATLADPEGNELCIVRSAAERGTPRPRDTGERAWTFSLVGDERSTMEALLDWYRRGVVAKVEGISPTLAVARPLRSGTTVAGLVHHLAYVEDKWFHDRFAGGDLPEPWASAPWDEDPDWEFAAAGELPMAVIVERYAAACDRSRAAVAGRSLDDLGARPAREGRFTLRFAFAHLVEETARHLGHLDILRELLDGTTGE